MVSSCSAYGCTNRQNSKTADPGDLGFHRFPLNKPQLLKKWVLATKRRNWQPTKNSYLCNSHFTEDCFKSSKRRYLKKDAVPTLFNFPPHLQKWAEKPPIKKVPLKVDKKASTSEIQPPPTTIIVKFVNITNQESNSSSQNEAVKKPIIIKDIQVIPSNSPLHNQELNSSSEDKSKGSSTITENIKHTSSNSLLDSQQTSSQNKHGECSVVIGNIQSTSSNSLLNSQQVVLSSEKRPVSPTITESIQSTSCNLPLNSQQLLPLEEKSMKSPITNESTPSNLMLASSLENVESAANDGITSSDYSSITPQLQLPSSEKTVRDQTCNKRDHSSDSTQDTSSKKICLRTERLRVTEEGLLRQKVRDLEKELSRSNEKILKLEKLLDLSLKYIGVPLKTEDLLKDRSVMQCFLESKI